MEDCCGPGCQGTACWDCRGTGHPHEIKPCPTCGGPVPCDTIWVRGSRFFCQERCAAEAPALTLPPGRR